MEMRKNRTANMSCFICIGHVFSGFASGIGRLWGVRMKACASSVAVIVSWLCELLKPFDYHLTSD